MKGRKHSAGVLVALHTPVGNQGEMLHDQWLKDKQPELLCGLCRQHEAIRFQWENDSRFSNRSFLYFAYLKLLGHLLNGKTSTL